MGLPNLRTSWPGDQQGSDNEGNGKHAKPIHGMSMLAPPNHPCSARKIDKSHAMVVGQYWILQGISLAAG